MLRGGVAPHGSVGLSLLLLLWKVDDERGLGFEADGDRVAGGSPQRTRFHVLDVDGQPPGGGVADSKTVPVSVFTWPSPIRIFSGRIPTATRPGRSRSASGETLTSAPPSSLIVSVPAAVPGRRFETPRKPATKAVRGRSYSSLGGPSCSTRPPFITAIVSAIGISSSWSCVTLIEGT